MPEEFKKMEASVLVFQESVHVLFADGDSGEVPGYEVPDSSQALAAVAQHRKELQQASQTPDRTGTGHAHPQLEVLQSH